MVVQSFYMSTFTECSPLTTGKLKHDHTGTLKTSSSVTFIFRNLQSIHSHSTHSHSTYSNSICSHSTHFHPTSHSYLHVASNLRLLQHKVLPVLHSQIFQLIGLHYYHYIHYHRTYPVPPLTVSIQIFQCQYLFFGTPNLN